MAMIELSDDTKISPSDLTQDDKEMILKALEETKHVPNAGPYTDKPDINTAYWHIGNGDKIYPATYNPRDEFDTGMVSVGGAFPTEEAAEKHLTYLKALQVLRGDTKGYEYEVGDEYYQGWWSVDEEELDFDSWTVVVNDGVKFKTQADIKDSFKAHEKEWRIVLGVE